MDAATIIALAKIASDLIVIVSIGLPKVDGLTDDQKRAMLANLQAQTATLTNALMEMAK